MRAARFAKLGLGCAALFLLTEVGLRWGVGLGDPPLVRLDAKTEYELIGPATYHRWGNRIEINDEGLRAAPLTDAGGQRILLIGDSVVYGGHFLDQKETIASQLGERLTKAAQCPVTVLSFAASSWGPVNQAAFLLKTGTFKAQMAGIMVSAHDLYDTPEAGRAILPYRTEAPWGAVHDAVLIALERLFPQTAPRPAATLEARNAATLEALDTMTDFLRSEGINPVLFYHPTMSERAAGRSTEKDAFQKWAAQLSVQFVDIGQTEITRDSYQDDIHPNAKGAGELAALMAGRFEAVMKGCLG